MEVKELWDQEADEIAADKGTVIVLGGVDTGKTTLVKYLGEKLVSRGLRVALIDGDMGQSFIGPPSTLGMILLEGDSTININNSTPYLRFVGSTTPSGHLLPTIIGLKKLVDKAKRLLAEIILIDTTGLISGQVGRELKHQKIELIEPSRIIALQRNNEMEHILIPLKFYYKSHINVLPIGDAVKNKSWDYRREYRSHRFRDYFQNAKTIECSFSEVAIWGSWIGSGKMLSNKDLNFLSSILKSRALYGEDCYNKIYAVVEGVFSTGEIFRARQYFKMRDVVVTDANFYQHILMSLDNPEGESQALALIEDIDFEHKKIILLTPIKELDRIERITFGSLRIHPSGNELEKISYPL